MRLEWGSWGQPQKPSRALSNPSPDVLSIAEEQSDREPPQADLGASFDVETSREEKVESPVPGNA